MYHLQEIFHTLLFDVTESDLHQQEVSAAQKLAKNAYPGEKICMVPGTSLEHAWTVQGYSRMKNLVFLQP